jgi:hypothetical protein
VRSITFRHNGAEWVATVGEELRGERTTTHLPRGELIERRETLSSTSRVLAVYPGSPFTIVTDAQPITSAPSEWANPFTAEPHQIGYFDGP